MSTLATIIQQSIGSLSLGNQTTQRNKRHPNRPGGGQTFSLCRRHDTLYGKPKRVQQNTTKNRPPNSAKSQDMKSLSWRVWGSGWRNAGWWAKESRCPAPGVLNTTQRSEGPRLAACLPAGTSIWPCLELRLEPPVLTPGAPGTSQPPASQSRLVATSPLALFSREPD